MDKFEGLFIPGIIPDAVLQEKFCNVVSRECADIPLCQNCLFNPDNLDAFKRWLSRDVLVSFVITTEDVTE